MKCLHGCYVVEIDVSQDPFDFAFRRLFRCNIEFLLTRTRCKIVLFQILQYFFRAAGDLFRHSGKRSDFDPEAAVCAAAHNFTEENNSVVEFSDRDFIIFNAVEDALQLGQFMIVRANKVLALRFFVIYSTTAQAMLSPSYVLVPLPTSSRIKRLFSVAFSRIFATSVISTIKVD